MFAMTRVGRSWRYFVEGYSGPIIVAIKRVQLERFTNSRFSSALDVRPTSRAVAIVHTVFPRGRNRGVTGTSLQSCELLTIIALQAGTVKLRVLTFRNPGHSLWDHELCRYPNTQQLECALRSEHRMEWKN